MCVNICAMFEYNKIEKESCDKTVDFVCINTILYHCSCYIIYLQSTLPPPFLLVDESHVFVLADVT